MDIKDLCEYHWAPMMNLMAYEGGKKKKKTDTQKETLGKGRRYKSKTERKSGKNTQTY